MMQNNYWTKILYPVFLAGIDSCTFASLSDQDLQQELDFLAQRAVAQFKFPHINLSYGFDEELEDSGTEKGYYFNSEITFKEINVIVAWMRAFWLEFQLAREKNYQNLYADKDVKAFSSGNLISSILKAYESAVKHARKVEEEYGRVTIDGVPAIGAINV